MTAGFLRHIDALNPRVEERLLPWCIAGQTVGWLRPGFAGELRCWPDIFQPVGQGLQLNPALDDFASRSAALASVTRELVAAGRIGTHLDEPYPVTAGDRGQALCTLDRGSVPCFGVRAFGQHLNGYVRDGDQLLMWIGRRAADRLIFPDHLDNLVAGGLPHGISPWDNLIKEAGEEAGMAPELTRQARPVGAVSYQYFGTKGLKPDVLFCYDLELPADFEPRNTDGEVDEFQLLPLQDVIQRVRETDEFKLNCNLVVMDFLIRHGYLGPDDADYLKINIGLRRPLGDPGQAWCL